MMRRAWLVLWIAAAGSALLALGCSDDAGTAPNQAPVVTFVSRPDPGAVVGERVTVSWFAIDPDGSVDHYQTSLDSETEFVDEPDSSTVLTFTKADGSDTNPMPHVFRVRAVDNRGLAGPAVAAAFTVAVLNDPPQVVFTKVPPSGEYAGAVIEFRWRGSDSDGTVIGYEAVIDDTTSAWTAVADTMLTVDFSSGGPVFPKPGLITAPAHEPRAYLFFVRAIDNEGKRSAPIGVSFLAGPENQAPVVTLVTAPPLPESGTVTGSATWVWTAVDDDGSILLSQYAVDLKSPAGWKRWDGTSLTLNFTRADGRAEDPVAHTFYLRAQDDDSLYSAPTTRDFLVGVPNQAPTVTFTAKPDSSATVNYYFTYTWKGSDDEAVASYEFAVDDTSGGWTSVPAATTSRLVVFSATDVLTASCNLSAGCSAFGDHVFRLRAVDNLGLRSAIVSSKVRVFNRTPTTTITAPTGTDGEVTGGTSFNMMWQGMDVAARPGQQLRYSVLAREVGDFGGFPDPTAAVAEPGLAWTDPQAGLTQTVLSLESGKKYLVAVRALDEAESVESLFSYGKNVLKVTVP